MKDVGNKKVPVIRELVAVAGKSWSPSEEET